VVDESLQLDYQREEREALYGTQERRTEFSSAKRTRQEYGPQPDRAKGVYHKTTQQPGLGNGRGTDDSRTFNPSERSFAKDSINRGASSQQRTSLFSPQKNLLDLTDLQFEQMCDEFFSDGPPIKFKARRGVKVEE
jgi:hypothetical protein